MPLRQTRKAYPPPSPPRVKRGKKSFKCQEKCSSNINTPCRKSQLKRAKPCSQLSESVTSPPPKATKVDPSCLSVPMTQGNKDKIPPKPRQTFEAPPLVFTPVFEIFLPLQQYLWLPPPLYIRIPLPPSLGKTKKKFLKKREKIMREKKCLSI